MICPHCGARLEVEDARFCANCGSPLEGAGQESEPTPLPQATAPTSAPQLQQGVKQGVSPAIVIGIALIAVLALVVATVIVLTSQSSDTDNVEDMQWQSTDPTTTNDPDSKDAGTFDGGASSRTNSSRTNIPTLSRVDHSLDTGTARFADTWRLESSSVDGFDAKTLFDASLKGKYVVLTLAEDGTGQLDKMGEETVDVTWKLENDEVGAYDGDGYSFEMRVTSDGGLVLHNDASQVMVFRNTPSAYM